MFELDLNSVHVEVEYIARVEQLHAESQFFAGVVVLQLQVYPATTALGTDCYWFEFDHLTYRVINKQLLRLHLNRFLIIRVQFEII